jgi:hypothetical protein
MGTTTSTFPHQHTDIADSGSSSFYFSRGAPVANYNPGAPTVSVTVANRSVASTTLASVHALPPSTMSGNVIPSFPHTLIGLGPFANQGCKIVFDKTSVIVYHPNGHPILNGWTSMDPTLAVPPHRTSFTSSAFTTLGSFCWGTISSHGCRLAAPQPRLPGYLRRQGGHPGQVPAGGNPIHGHGSPRIQHFLQPTNTEPPQHWHTH